MKWKQINKYTAGGKETRALKRSAITLPPSSLHFFSFGRAVLFYFPSSLPVHDYCAEVVQSRARVPDPAYRRIRSSFPTSLFLRGYLALPRRSCPSTLFTSFVYTDFRTYNSSFWPRSTAKFGPYTLSAVVVNCRPCLSLESNWVFTCSLS